MVEEVKDTTSYSFSTVSFAELFCIYVIHQEVNIYFERAKRRLQVPPNALCVLLWYFPLPDEKKKKKTHSESPADSWPENTWCYSDKIKPYVLSFSCFGSSWALGVKMSVNGCLSFHVGKASSWRLIKGVPRLLAKSSWDRLQGLPSRHPVNEKCS